MNAEKFSESLGNVKDKYIEEAVHFETQPAPQKKGTSVKVWKTIAIASASLAAAAVLIMAVGLGSLQTGNRSVKNAAPENAPFESYQEEGLTEDGAESVETGIYAGAEISDNKESFLADPSFAEEMSGEGAAVGKSGSDTKTKDSKIIYTANIHISTKDFPASEAKLDALTKKYNGFFETMDVNQASASYRSAYYTIRIPSENLDAFLKDAEMVGTVASLNRSGTDVSETYYDTQARLETAKKKLARLQELLSKANDISEIIAIEESISDVEYEIDALTGALKNYDSDVSYSTVSINLEEVYSDEDGDEPALSFGERISKGFKEGLNTFRSVAEEVLVWFAASWLWLLLAGIVIAAVIIIIIKSERKTKKK